MTTSPQSRTTRGRLWTAYLNDDTQYDPRPTLEEMRQMEREEDDQPEPVADDDAD